MAELLSWPGSMVFEAAQFLNDLFYSISGWRPVQMRENRVRAIQQKQINESIEDQKRRGETALYAFEKERILLANIRAGDRNEARRILNEMLAAIYLSSPKLVVLRARAVELMSCLTRAAIEDNPLMEPLIERNHTWTERMVKAADFENLSQVLMEALDDFIDGIYLHGVNRSNSKVHRALDFINANFASDISLRGVAVEVGLSPCRLAHLVKEFTGRTVLQIIQQVRVRHAQHLLERSSMSCTEIAYEVGYGDQSYFTRQFRRLTGTTPARYRKARSLPRRPAT
jgi:AraC-like DNA-binding protein